MRKMTPGRITIYVLLSLYALLVIYPMFWLVATSFKDSWSIFKSPWGLPETLNWHNYVSAMQKGELAHKIWNSLVVDLIALGFILLFSAMAAYVLARFRFPGNRVLFYTFLSGMTIPVFLAVVPLFILVNQIHLPLFSNTADGWRIAVQPLLGTRTGLVLVYVAFSLSFTIFVLTGFFRGLPWELAEAAVIDGCNPSQVFWRIMLPLAKPGLATAGIFVFIGLWNEYPLALVLLSDESAHTLPLGIANLTMSQKYQADWGALFAGLTIGVLPTLILYILFQRQIQKGLTAGAVKG